MALVSVTRLRVRSVFLLPAFLWHAIRSSRQAERAPGFLAGRLLTDAKMTFWTMTAWGSPETMNAFRTAAAHKIAMPKLLGWCDEASVVQWEQPSAELPPWTEAHRRMVTEGRLSKVGRPSAAQKANHIEPPRPDRMGNAMNPANRPNR